MSEINYDIIYADPPWLYNSNNSLAKNSILSKSRVEIGKTVYKVMDLKFIKSLKIKEICSENSLLFIWVTNPMLPEAMEVISSWGFKYATVAFVWEKVNPNPGSYTLSSVESCIVAKRGKIPQPRGVRNARQFYMEKKTRHSKKPKEFFNRITQMFPEQKKLELFARTKPDKNLWDAWGLDVDGKTVEEQIMIHKLKNNFLTKIEEG